MLRHTLLSALLLAFLFSAIGCTSSSNDDDDDGSGSDGDSLRTQCGVVYQGILRNPIPITDGQTAIIRSVAGSVYLNIELLAGPELRLIKLLGIRDSGVPSQTAQAQALLSRLAGAQIIYYPAQSGCSAPGPIAGGVNAEVGSLVTLSGTSISENLLENGAVEVETTNQCGSNQVMNCYSALLDQNDQDSDTSTGEPVGSFLWKPESERDGNLAVLVDPFGANVYVNGALLTNFGPSNGYGTTARANQSGCAYGSNVEVRVLDGITGDPYSIQGSDTYIIPNGCDRVQF